MLPARQTSPATPPSAGERRLACVYSMKVLLRSRVKPLTCEARFRPHMPGVPRPVSETLSGGILRSYCDASLTHCRTFGGRHGCTSNVKYICSLRRTDAKPAHATSQVYYPDGLGRPRAAGKACLLPRRLRPHHPPRSRQALLASHSGRVPVRSRTVPRPETLESFPRHPGQSAL